MAQYVVIIWIILLVAQVFAKKRTNQKKPNARGESAYPGMQISKKQTSEKPASHVFPPIVKSKSQNREDTFRSRTSQVNAETSYFSFKNLAKGEDELDALIRRNHEHEKYLQARLVSREKEI